MFWNLVQTDTRKMKICLFALTGLGNFALNRLCQIDYLQDILVFTREEKGKYPYFECEPLTILCNRQGVNYHCIKSALGEKPIKIIEHFSPSMVLVVTFHAKITNKIINLVNNEAVNVHPSLLPHYRGPTPTNWTIINDEKVTGITYHRLTNEYDSGPILLQKKIAIESFFTDGILRHRIGKLIDRTIPEFLDKYKCGKLTQVLQEHHSGTYYPNINSNEAMELLKNGDYQIDNIVNGLTPYPGKDYYYRGIDCGI